MATEEELLAWLDDEVHPWVPATCPQSVQSHARPPQSPAMLLQCPRCVSMLRRQIESDEAAARAGIAAAAADGISELALTCLVSLPQEPRRGKPLPLHPRAVPDSDDESEGDQSAESLTAEGRRERDRATHLANRRLLASDLIKELYEANQALRQQLQAIMAMLATRGSPANPPAAGALSLTSGGPGTGRRRK